ncbi:MULTISPECIES: biotin--[acetyl-CoA-carboxylase] ligase [unclassified Butyrivibrio]|uniref:biotin--[acetyl-CoA-carboxylase] ligase n=1 Tax=unclassified Butyrivibrio TaxID=2639466 RepID=UPI0003B3F0F6|nr:MULTISPECIES: biotin--[acetyl-CoA-carboxylase] ligase [unclassified Butyrivibrio]
MTDTKSLVLNYLEDNSGRFSSGEVIAKELKLSRNSVWKAIESLRREGYIINASPRRGYSLSAPADNITLSGIAKYLSPGVDSELITIYDELESTNKTARSMASFDAPHGSVIISKTQTGGTGRKKRHFSSPKGGIYMSIILRPERMNIFDYSLITPFVGVCVCKALESAIGVFPSIKWLNDLYIDDKKICGILSEAGTDFDTGELQYIVIGIGINFNSDINEFPPDLRKTAGSLFEKGGETISKDRLIADILNNILTNDVPDCIVEEYKSRMKMLGSTIRVITTDGNYEAKAIDVNEKGKLIVELPDKTTKILSSEDVSTKSIKP